jgi:hypothetical protein
MKSGACRPSGGASEGQLALLAEHGEERRAEVGDVPSGRRPTLSIIAIIEGRRPSSTRPVRSSTATAGRLLGESNLLRTDRLLDGCGRRPMRYIAVEREQLRTLLFQDTALSDLLL